MFTQYWTSRAAIFTTIGMLISVTLPAFIDKRIFAQTPPVQSQCSDANIQKYIKQLNKAEPAAFNALVGCNSQAVPALIKALKNPYVNTKIITVAALGEIGENAEPAVPSLIKLLSNKNEDIQIITVHALGEIGKDGILGLIVALKHHNWKVRYLAAYKLESTKEVAKKAIPALIQALKDTDIYVRTQASDALGKMGKNAVPALTLALKDQNPFVRRGAAEALGKIGTGAKSALPILKLIAALDKIPEVRISAAHAARIIPNAVNNQPSNLPHVSINSYISYEAICEREGCKQSEIPGRRVYSPSSLMQNSTRSVAVGVQQYIRRQPVICRIPTISFVFRWKCR